MQDKKKKVLVFYPHNFYEMSSGTHRRIYELLSYLRDRNFSTDLLSLNGFSNKWNSGDLSRRDLFDSIRVCEWKLSYMEKIRQARSAQNHGLSDLVTQDLKNAIAEMASAVDYSFIIITYAYWGRLAEVDSRAIKIFNFQDFLTLNTYLQNPGVEFALGKMFQDEVRAISRFEYALSISEEETVALSPFCPGTVFINAPISFPKRFIENAGRDFDILFIGSDNPFNREGMDWFMKEAYPLLPHDLKIAVVGKICSHVEQKKNMTRIPFLEDLSEIHRKSKLLICPLKGGTGLKIKVIEALSFGMPVVTTSWGLKGILSKTENGCVLAESGAEFAQAIIRILGNESEFENLRQQARMFFSKYYSTEMVHENLDKLFMREHGAV
ncbi:MAG: glycosyltransferase family 4 protein [Deltaproteobacteria bacterium]|nr:glycosyltransferase family 4 protein [Deltaproteobacteria bacterium]